MQVLISALLGGLFGLGLLLSGMVNPAKVQGFLDLAGAWDPSLALVMGGAIAVGLPLFALARRRPVAVCGADMQVPPPSATVDRKLLVGAALFGIGWGLAGICPGPALVGLGTGQADFVIFVLAMLAGMLIHSRWGRRG
ncbi:DUF6691 family protein [Chitinibacteraceae bacterium HSL-7]